MLQKEGGGTQKGGVPSDKGCSNTVGNCAYIIFIVSLRVPTLCLLFFLHPLLSLPFCLKHFQPSKETSTPPSSKHFLITSSLSSHVFLHFCLFIQLKYERKIAGVKYCNTYLCFNFHAVFLLKGLQDWNRKNKHKDNHRLDEEEKSRHMVSG